MGMDVRDYDIATLKRLLYFFPNTHWINKPNLSIMEIRNKKIQDNEDIDFPVITVRRVSAPILYKETNSWSSGIQGDQCGRSILVNKSGEKYSADITTVQSNFELKYMVEVFSFERDNFDELFVEVQENLFRYPYITFNNYKDSENNVTDLQVPGISTNIMVESCEDNTDFESLTSQTPFYRGTMTFSIRAYIYRKYNALLIDEISSGYKVLDWKGVVRQVIDTLVTTNSGEGVNVYNSGTELDKIGSIGVFQYIGEDGKSYGSEVEGRQLKPITISIPDNGVPSYSIYNDLELNGTWKLLSSAKYNTNGEYCLVMAVRIS